MHPSSPANDHFNPQEFYDADFVDWTDDVFQDHIAGDSTMKRVPSIQVAYHRLNRKKLSVEILVNLSGEAFEEGGVHDFARLVAIQPAHLLSLLKQLCESGDREPLIVFMPDKDKDDKFWVVEAIWEDYKSGWNLYGMSINGSPYWKEGRRVLSRDS